MLEVKYRKTEELIPYARNKNYSSDINGNIYRTRTEQKSKSGKSIIKNEIVMLRGSIDKYGYKTVRIVVEGKKKHIKAHRIIAETFIENTENKKEVNHINGIKTDNRVENLEWTTRAENNMHAIKSGLLVFKKGDHSKQTKVLSSDFTSIYLMHKFAGYSRKKIAELNNVSKQTIDKIINKVEFVLLKENISA